MKELVNIIDYFKRNEKNRKNFKIGAEFEYFIVDKKTLKSVGYSGENGVLSSLREILSLGYEGIYEKGNLLGLVNDNSTITLEPGSQIEISIKPYKDLNRLEKEYKKICHDILTVLEKKGQVILSTGYRVKDTLNEINLIPKQRYHYMYEYFKSCGKYAHNMMKMTASTQVSIDYENEADYIKKYRILNVLSPVFYAFFDNAPFFEGNIYDKYCIRSQIWDNCDEKRCGVITDAITDHFSYASYAQFIINQALIFNGDKYLDHTLFKDMFSPNLIDHALSMVFPDIRTRKYIEIRMVDSLPYPLNFSVIALIKGLFYNDTNLDEIYQFVQKFNIKDVLKTKNDIVEKSINANLSDLTVYDIVNYIYSLAVKGLPQEELPYLAPLKNLLDIKMTLKDLIMKSLNEDLNKALADCIFDKRLLEEK